MRCGCGYSRPYNLVTRWQAIGTSTWCNSSISHTHTHIICSRYPAADGKGNCLHRKPKRSVEFIYNMHVYNITHNTRVIYRFNMVQCKRTVSSVENTQNNINQLDRVSHLSRRAIVRIYIDEVLSFSICVRERKTLYYDIYIYIVRIPPHMVEIYV